MDLFVATSRGRELADYFEKGEIPLTIHKCDHDIWSSDPGYAPSVWDGSEGDTYKWETQDLVLVAYGVP